jgi:hypothetical protein
MMRRYKKNHVSHIGHLNVPVSISGLTKLTGQAVDKALEDRAACVEDHLLAV